MRLLRRCLFVVFLAGLIAFSSGPGKGIFADPPQENELFLSAGPATGSSAADAAGGPVILRTRRADINFPLLESHLASADAGTSEEKSLTLNLFADVRYQADLRHIQRRADGTLVWSGDIRDGGGSVNLVAKDGVLVGNVRQGGNLFQIRYSGDGSHKILEVDTSTFPEALEPLRPHISEDAPPEEPGGGAAGDDGSTFDVLVVYTPAARAAEGSTTAMEALITLAETETNTAYANSSIAPRINVVHTEEVTYTESGSFATDLQRLGNTNSSGVAIPPDGFMDNVQTLRDAHAADLVVLVIEASGSCGLAWVMTNLSSTFERLAYSVVAGAGCMTGNYTFGHEMGHNMGLQHDRATQPADGVFAYSHGYADNVDPVKFRTIMAYTTACPGCTRIQYFSNPNVNFNGEPTGIDESDTANSADSAKSINNVASTVANWRDSSAATAAPTVSSVSPSSGSTAGGTTVTITGTGFVAGGTTVTFGGSAGTSVNVSSSTSLTVVTPAGSAGAVDVKVTTANGSATLAGGFTYVDTSSTAQLVASVLPSSRSVQVGTAATAFVTIINADSSLTAFNVGISLNTSVPGTTLTYQTTDPSTNQVTGSANTPVNIGPGSNKSFVIALTPSAAVSPTDVQFNYAGLNTAAPSVITGVNTLLFSASSSAVPDIVALAATTSNDGIVNVPGVGQTGAFAVATVNVGASGSITASADDGGQGVPITITLCETDPAVGNCISSIGSSVTTTINANATPTFGIFVKANQAVSLDPATKRVFVRFKDSGGVTRGSTSVAVRTQ